MSLFALLVASLANTGVQVAFGAAGAGVADTSSPADVAYPAGISAGDGLYLHAYQIGAGAVNANVATPSGWTLLDTQDDGASPVVYRSRVFFKRAVGDESGNLSITWLGGGTVAARMYRLNAVSVNESVNGSFAAGSSTTITAEDVTASVGKALALQFIGAEVNTTIGAITGESGGDYAEAVAEYASATGPVTLSLQAATLAAGGAVSGGSATLGAAGTNRVVHGLVAKP